MKRIMLLRMCSMVLFLMLFVQADMLAQANKQTEKPTIGKAVKATPSQNALEKNAPAANITKATSAQKSVADRKEKMKPGDRPNSKTPINPYLDVKPNAGIPLGVEDPRPGKVKGQ